MSGHRHDNSEIREAVFCIAPPSIYTVLQGNDAHFYPVRLIVVGDHLYVESFLFNSSGGFESYEDALQTCILVRTT